MTVSTNGAGAGAVAEAGGKTGAAENPLKKYIGHPQGPDSMRAWIVALFAVLYVFFGWCAFSSTPVLYVALMKTNPELTRELASWPFTIMACCSFTGGAVYGLLINYVAEQHLLLIGAVLTSSALFASSFFTQNLIGISMTLGLVHGIGLACTTCIPSAVISQHFIKYRASAMSLFSISAALTGIVYPPLATWLFERYSLSGLLMILSAICLNQVVSAIVCKAASWKPALQEMARATKDNDAIKDSSCNNNSNNNNNNNGNPTVIQLRILNNNSSNNNNNNNNNTTTNNNNRNNNSSVAVDSAKDFVPYQGFCSWLLVNTCVTNALANFIMFALFLIVIDFEADNGIGSALGSSLVVVLSVGWLIASIVVGPVVDKGEYYDRYAILSSCLIQLAGLLLMVYFKGLFWWQVAGCFLVGWGQGSRGFLMFVMLSKRYPPSRAALAFATMNLSCFPPFFLRTPLIGLIRDNLGSYDYLIHLFEAINVLLAVDWLVMSVYRR